MSAVAGRQDQSRPAVTAIAAIAVLLIVVGCGSDTMRSSASTEPTTVNEASTVNEPRPTEAAATSAAVTTVVAETTDARPAPSTTAPTDGIALIDWIEQQEADGRTDGYAVTADGTDAKVVLAYTPGQFSEAAGGLLLATGQVIDLPDGISPNRSPMLAGLDGRPALVSPLNDQYALWLLDPATNTWSQGPELGVFADRQSIAFVAVLDGRLVVANQTVRESGTGFYAPDRFEGVIVSEDLSTSPMSAPPAGQFLSVTSTVGAHALMLGLDSAAGTNAPLTQPWDFDVTANAWTAVPHPDWLRCVPDCNWRAPHEHGDVHFEVVAGGRVVMMLPDGSIGQYVPGTQTWTRLGDTPFQLAAPAVAVLGDQLAIAPAFTEYGTNEPGVVGVLDLATGTWTTNRIDIGEQASGAYVAIEARTDGAVALFDAVHTGQQTPEPSTPDVAYDSVARNWRPPTEGELAKWTRGNRTGNVRDLLA